MNVRLDQFVNVTKQAEKMLRIICINTADPLFQTATSKPSTLQTYLLRTKSNKVSQLTVQPKLSMTYVVVFNFVGF
jgi:hypothetical protein